MDTWLTVALIWPSNAVVDGTFSLWINSAIIGVDQCEISRERILRPGFDVYAVVAAAVYRVEVCVPGKTAVICCIG
jgi:hypothetical protein